MKTLERTGISQVDEFRRQVDDGWRPRQHAYVVLLGLKTRDAGELHSRLEAGLSYMALERLRQVLDVSVTTLSRDLLKIPARTLARRRKAKRLHADESDRLMRLARVVGLAIHLFEGDLHEARAWLLAPQGALGGRRPLEFATSEVGAREVENLIGRLEHGIPL